MRDAPSGVAVHAYDAGESVAVCLLAGPVQPAEARASLDATLSLLRRQDLECRHPGGPVFVLAIAPSWPLPDARSRGAAADAARQLRSSRHCLAIVTSSGLVRGALRAVTWLAPPRAEHTVAIVDEVEAAYAAAERARGAPLPALRALGARTFAGVASW